MTWTRRAAGLVRARQGDASRWVRRAQPLLGTLVEVGAAAGPATDEALSAAFAAVRALEAQLSRFEPASDVGRYNALPAGGAIEIGTAAREVLAAAASLFDATGGAFDVCLAPASDEGRAAAAAGKPPAPAWRLEGRRVVKLRAGATLDLGGIAKGYIVDRAVEALAACGTAGGWVNAGGDLRAFGSAAVPVMLRDEATGGVRHFATLGDGAFATSRFADDSRAGPLRRANRIGVPDGAPASAHVSVAAERCLWADALTKVVALSGDTSHPLLARHGARAWLH